jgi:hypothetical protein
MIVSLGPIDFDDDFRRALRSYRGKVGLATGKEILSWIDGLINDGAENVMYDFNGSYRVEVSKIVRRNRGQKL